MTSTRRSLTRKRRKRLSVEERRALLAGQQISAPIGMGLTSVFGLAASRPVIDTAAGLPSASGLGPAAGLAAVTGLQVRIIKDSGVFQVQTRPKKAKGEKGWRTRSRHLTRRAANQKANSFK